MSVAIPQPLHVAAEAKTSRSTWGGPRPGFGGPQPGSGRPRKATPPAPARYATDHAQWRVLATWGQAERLVVQELTRQGYETYLPLVAIRRRDPAISSMWHEVRVPLFPGYAFIRLTNAETREPIAATRGVRELLHRPDGRLSVVSDGEVDRLRGGDETRLRLPKETAPVLAAGAAVRITEGAFSGLSGAVAECDGVRTRVVLALFDRDVPIWLDRVAVVEAA